MQVRVDDDMRVIVTLTPEEFNSLGGNKGGVADFAERVFSEQVAFNAAAEAELRTLEAEVAEMKRITEAHAEAVSVLPGGEFAAPAETPVDPSERPEVISE